ncbi:alpha,alpha-trehalose-phosphate synthase (UDP-forming) [Streptomyces violascens]|uniref:Trehalose-6-phosphate synthase n=1 Tax=Streptomyces violascens TaxID=67381 RepID=A0ABQ3QQD4_9ACTN|nr:trehalose-6-phosphate synthase [Streptomyces violascens]GGU20432.1 trehalose-6-phosphate synthase [Streptomyces violascens]GHI39486.1 trehalose-6-phosphate synthase [Streptomyces violascens]
MVTAHAAPRAQVLVASNRGPVSYALKEDGSLESKRGGGGLVSGLSAIGSDVESVWVCAALGEGDREAVRRGVGETGVRMLDIDPAVFSDAYNGVANSVLWFVQHMLYQTPLEPVFDAEFRRQWASYEAYNRAFAEALAAEAGDAARVLVQDYHLALVPGMLRSLRPDLRIAHFSHTPWAPVDYFRMLPDDIARQLLRGMLGADRLGFLTWRWASAFAESVAGVLGADEGEWVGSPGGEGRVFFRHGVSGERAARETDLAVHPLGADGDFLRRRAHEADVEERMAALREQIGEGRRTIVRVDRTELSKNIVRGLLAYRHLLDTHPEWRERVVHVAFAYPSRQDLAVYREYTEEVGRVAAEINSVYGVPGWTPVVLHVQDDFARSLAAYRLADVALVNPVRDGMNLVAKEVPVVSDSGCALVLSREAGAVAELGDDAIVVNPYDITGTAAALHAGLSMAEEERAERTKRLAVAGTAVPPRRWFLGQLEGLGG